MKVQVKHSDHASYRHVYRSTELLLFYALAFGATALAFLAQFSQDLVLPWLLGGTLCIVSGILLATAYTNKSLTVDACAVVFRSAFRRKETSLNYEEIDSVVVGAVFGGGVSVLPLAICKHSVSITGKNGIVLVLDPLCRGRSKLIVMTIERRREQASVSR